ncbi:phage tail protein [Lysinibacillus sp. NPDC093712]|uniref:phage tail protein n=1 Tax=Lysinibacillus sp. NPDC093712 TaxID=3390579 RepID=UPI003CFD9C8D
MNILSLYIDDVLSKKAMKPNIYLCKPDKTRIHKLKDIYDVKLHQKLGTVNELSFTIPPYIDRNHELIDNPLITKVKQHYFVELQFKNSTEYFVVLSQNKSMSNDGESISYKLYSSAYLLNNKPIKSYEVTSYTLSELVFDFLTETDWSMGHIDVDFDVNTSNALRRSFEIDSSTVLQCLYDVATKFNALIVFDTVNQKVSFYNPDKLGLNRGWKLKKGRYLESFDVDINIDEIVTRMYCYGSEGLEFRSLSPTGSNYLEDFSWYMHPFKCDDNFNVITHSDYMSDGLCIAITKYNKLINTKKGEFESLSSDLTAKNAELVTLQQELSVLETELTTFKLELDAINATYDEKAPSRPDYQLVMSKINAKNVEILNKNTLITSKKNQISGIESKILTLKTLLLVENNYTRPQLLELNKFIISKDFIDDTISEEKDLLEASISHFKKVNEPAITLNLNIVNFLNDIEFIADRDKINLGDIVKLQSETLEVSISSKIIEIIWDIDKDDISLTIANEKDLIDDNAKLVDMIYSSANTSTMVNMNKYKLDIAVNANNMVTQIINSEFDTAKNVLVGGYENSNTMNERGFYSRDIQDDKAYLVINNGILAITPDGGNSISVAISKRGVHAEKLAGKLILGNKLVVESDLGLFTIDGAVQTIFDANKTKKVELGRYTDPNNSSTYKYGLRIYDGALDIRTSSNANQGIQLDNSGFRSFNSNGVRTFNVNAITGQVEIIGDLTIKSSPSSYRGVAITSSGITGYNASGGITFELNANTGKSTIQENFNIQTSQTPNRGVKMDDYGIRGYNSSGTKTFEIDIYGNATFSGNITASNISGTIINGTTINGGTINGVQINSANIDISDNISVGSRLVLKGNQSEIWFNSSINSINANSGNLNLFTLGNLNLLAPNVYLGANSYSIIDFNGASSRNTQNISVGSALVATRASNADTASFATQAQTSYYAGDATYAQDSNGVRGLHIAYNGTFVYIRDQRGYNVAQLKRSDV